MCWLHGIKKEKDPAIDRFWGKALPREISHLLEPHERAAFFSLVSKCWHASIDLQMSLLGTHYLTLLQITLSYQYQEARCTSLSIIVYFLLLAGHR